MCRFASDNRPGMAVGAGMGEEALVKDELGWSITYKFDLVCTSLKDSLK